MSLNLYDVLDVDPSASPDEIRTAWKAAIADLGPGDRRFRAYNDAAEVLLDPERRTAYDAELAAEGEAATEEPEVVEPAPEPRDDHEPQPQPEPEPGPAVEPVAPAAAARPGAAPWLVAAVGAVAAAVLAVTIVVWLTTDRGDDGASEPDGSVEEAVAAAEEAAVPMLSYDYRSFDEDVVEAESFMTTEQAAEHSDLMNLLRESVVAQKAIVEAQLQGSGVVRVNGDMAEILVMVNQLTEKTGTEPFLLPVWATLRMVNEDGEWLVDGIRNERTPTPAG